MDDNTAYVLCLLILFGWIPILSVGKALAWMIEAWRSKEWQEDGQRKKKVT